MYQDLLCAYLIDLHEGLTRAIINKLYLQIVQAALKHENVDYGLHNLLEQQMLPGIDLKLLTIIEVKASL